jgi:hypothetical protein
LGLITAAFTNVKFQMVSTECGDQWQVTACSTAGVGTLNLAPVNLSATNHYLDIAATKGNVLLTNFRLSIHL